MDNSWHRRAILARPKLDVAAAGAAGSTPLRLIVERPERMPSQFETLTEINLDDLVNAVGWQDRPRLRAILRRAAIGLARAFAGQMVEYDQDVGRTGLQAASRTFLGKHARGLRVFGGQHLPTSGPLLVLSNHPGLSDTLALFSALDRPDLKIIARHVPFLAALANISRQLYYLNGDAAQSMTMVRGAAAHLRAGGAILTFPAGDIEPDPEVYDGALEALDGWDDSAGVFMRFAPETTIVPALVSGVIWQQTARHWLTRTRKSREEREVLAAALQLFIMLTLQPRPTTITVRFGRPITLADVGAPEIGRIHEAVTERMRELLRTPPAGEGLSAL
jgi:1-acyl-sn-glycerol-3-phosphate acyltransferase